MGEVLCEGKDALANLNQILTNDFTNMVDGQARYSPMCNEHGGTVDDLIVYKKSDEHYFIVVNAANKDKDYQWMLRHQFGEVTFKDVSSGYAQIALQGPKAMQILKKLTAEENIPKQYSIRKLPESHVSFPRQDTQVKMAWNCIWQVRKQKKCGIHC